MKGTRMLLLSALVMMLGNVWAQGPNNTGTYYQGANGKSGAALKTAMSQIINPHTKIGYDGLWEAYKTTDTRADGKVRDWYSNITNYRHITDKAGNYSSEGDCYNREHTVPQSWFNKAEPLKSDIVHVVPTDGKVNGMRSDWPFGDVATVSYASANNYSKLGSCKSAGYTGKVFEPNDEIKGDIARIYFYMATCYQSQCGSWGGDIFTSTGMVKWELDVMMAWSKLDPVDDVEKARNNAVQQVQNNRNPFVDYPGLEDYIWGDKTDVSFSYDNYQPGEVVSVAKPTFTPDAGTYYNSVEVTISCKTADAVIYYTTNGEDASEQSLLYEGPITLTETATIKAVAIKDGERSAQSEATYTITDEPVQPGGGDTPAAECEITLNNVFFQTDATGVIASSNNNDLTGTQDGVTVTYALGTGGQRYCNDNHIRLYAGNTLTVSVSEGNLTAIEFVTKNTDKQLEASTGTIDGYKWTGDSNSVVFNVNSGSKNLQVTTLKISVAVPSEGPATIDKLPTTTLNGQRVVYNLRGQRVVNPNRGIYIVDGRKVVID